MQLSKKSQEVWYDMGNLFLDFFSEWYNLVPVEFIILCLCVYFFIKLVHKGIRLVLVSIIIVTFIQSMAYLLFGWGYILLTKNTKCLPQILHGVICVEWVALAITWCLQV